MLELDQLVVSRINDDTTVSTLLGGTEEDNRIYAWYPATDISYTIGVAETAIIYRNSLGGRPFNWSYPSQIGNILYFFRVLSISQLNVRLCAERLIELFDQTSIESDNWNAKYIELNSYTDGMYEGSPTHPIISKNVTFDFKVVVNKGLSG